MQGFATTNEGRLSRTLSNKRRVPLLSARHITPKGTVVKQNPRRSWLSLPLFKSAFPRLRPAASQSAGRNHKW
jgi:hypothetical protein